MKKILAAMLVSMFIAGCASTSTSNSTYDETRGWAVEKLYSEAHDELDNGNYTRATDLYEILESRYPYGTYAQQTQMDLAYAHYKSDEPELALAEIERFMKMYPAHKNLDYLYYLKGLVYFNNDASQLSKLASQDLSERDPKASREAFAAFSELSSRFPNSQYVPDANKKIHDIVLALGGHEMHVAGYYMRRGAYLAAVNRAKSIVLEYKNTPYPEEALALMIAGYKKLGEDKLSEDTKRVLALNYPNSKYLKTEWSYKGMSWWQFWH